jgi:hypothetical protein
MNHNGWRLMHTDLAPRLVPDHHARRYVSLAVIGGLCLALVVGCASGGPSSTTGATLTRAALERYVTQIEPIRLGVNRLLNGADPILEALRRHRISNRVAAVRLATLERRFAGFTVDVAAIQPANGRLRSLHAGYAQTYILEDAYLSALVSGVDERNLENLPRTQSAQRAAIIRWRTALTVLAREYGAPLPSDLQQAGRGEIAPSIGGS